MSRCRGNGKIRFLCLNIDYSTQTLYTTMCIWVIVHPWNLLRSTLVKTTLALLQRTRFPPPPNIKTLNKGEYVVVCLPGARIEHVTERVENTLGHGQGGSILVHVGTNNADREGTTRIVQGYTQLVGKLKKTRVEQIILSGILPVMGGRGVAYRNCKTMAINVLVEQMCEEEGVGFVDLWGYFVGKEDMYMRDGLHLSGKGAAIFSENLLRSMDSGTGCSYLN